MSSFFIYLIKVSFVIALLSIVYFLFFDRKQDFKWNRLYLIVSILISLCIPLLNINISEGSNVVSEEFQIELNITQFQNNIESVSSVRDSDYNIISFLFYIYWIVLFLLFLRMIWFFLNIFKTIRNNQVVKYNGFKVVSLENGNSPFSFFKYLFINDTLYKPRELEQIYEHEKIHIKHFHSLDVMLLEVYSMFLWFNPFVFFLKNSMKINHEFLADFSVMRSGYNMINYQKLLVKEAFALNSVGFVNNFKSVTVKKRIKMLQKYNSKTKSRRLIKSIMILPLISLTVLFFGFSNDKGVISLNHSTSGQGVDNPPKISPIKGLTKNMISMEYGKKFINPFNKKGKTHFGIDIRSKKGTEILAPTSGTVMKVEEHDGYGKLVVIKHDDRFSTLFAHMSNFNCKIGDKVKGGDVIGYVGNTGLSTGPHLHYEVIKDGERVDPFDYLSL